MTDIKECRCKLPELINAAKEKDPTKADAIMKKYMSSKRISNKWMLFSL